MKNFKKSALFVFSFVILGVVALTLSGCKNNSNTKKTTADNTSVSTETNDASKGSVEKTDTYSLEMELIQETTGKSLSTKIKVAQKPGKYMVSVLKRPENMGNVPMLPKETIIKDDKVYSLITIDGKDTWFVLDSTGQAANMMQMNMYGMLQEQLATTAEKTKTESVDGKKGKCFYYDSGTTKICVDNTNHIFYAEGVNGNGGKTIVKVNSYTTKVNDKVFEVKGEVKGINELMKYLGNSNAE